MAYSRTLNMRLAALSAITLLALAAGVAVYTSTLAHAQTGTEPVINNVSVTPQNTGATVTWSTDQNSNAQVWYGTTTGGENATTTLSDTGTGSTTHTAFIGGLTPNTPYF